MRVANHLSVRGEGLRGGVVGRAGVCKGAGEEVGGEDGDGEGGGRGEEGAGGWGGDDGRDHGGGGGDVTHD